MQEAVGRPFPALQGGANASIPGQGFGRKLGLAILLAPTKSGLLGSFPLTFDGITLAVKRKAPGVFALGHTGPDGKFHVKHVGRSDTDVQEKLRDYIGSANLFKFGYFATAKAAFEKECELFHDFRPPGNRVHPDRPAGTTWECPRCRIFRHGP